MSSDDKTKSGETPEFKRVVGYFLRTPPKPHEDMKLGKGKRKPAKRRAKKKAVEGKG